MARNEKKKITGRSVARLIRSGKVPASLKQQLDAVDDLTVNDLPTRLDGKGGARRASSIELARHKGQRRREIIKADTGRVTDLCVAAAVGAGYEDAVGCFKGGQVLITLAGQNRQEADNE